jgi:hypothetical protein
MVKSALGSYELFQRSRPLEGAVWDEMMRGLRLPRLGARINVSF